MGIYRDGSKGSPVRAAEMSEQNKAAGKKSIFRCINVEENSEYFANLQSSTAAFGADVLNLHGTFAANVDRIPSGRLESTLLLAFLILLA